MQKKTLPQVELLVLNTTLTHFEDIFRKSQHPSETIITQIRVKVEETHSGIFDHLDRTTIDQILIHTYDYLSFKCKNQNSQLGNATQFKEESEEIKILKEAENTLHQQIKDTHLELNILDNFVNSNFINALNFETLVLPKKEPLIIIKKEQDINHAPFIVQPPSNPITNHRAGKRMIQTKLRLVQIDKNQSNKIQWPRFFLTRRQFETRAQVIAQNTLGRNAELKTRLLVLANSEIRHYKDELIYQRREELRRIPSQKKITDLFTTQLDRSLIQFQPINRLQQRMAHYGEIRIGNIKFQYFFDGREDIQFRDFTFIDKTFELKLEELLELHDERFISRATCLLPKRRKGMYNHLFYIHKILA